MKKFNFILLVFLSISFVAFAQPNSTKEFTLVNRTGAPASDLHLVFTGAGNVLNGKVVKAPAAGQNYGTTNNPAAHTVDIVWNPGNVPNQASVKINVTTNSYGWDLDSAYWTDASHNQQGSSVHAADTIRLVTTVASGCFPPSTGTRYRCSNSFFQNGPYAVNGVMFQISPCQAPPASGTQTQSFTGTAQGTTSFSGPFSCNVSGTLSLTATGSQNTSNYYDAEMITLNLFGGTLPGGVLIRESPTLVSTGQTIITQDAGQFYISSFFDVFTELSLDGGNNWMPTNPPLHDSELQPDASTSIPTLNQWGLIIFGVLIVAGGVVILRRMV